MAAAVVVARMRGSGIAVGSVEHGDGGAIVFLSAAGCAFVLYAGAVALLRHRRAPLVAVCVVALAIQLLPLAGPLLLSRDVFAYWDYGRIASTHDANPYTQLPSRYPHDPAFRSMAVAWHRTPSVYGPAFTGVSAGLAQVTGSSAETAAATYRIAAAAGMVALVALVVLRARRRALAAAAVGWNPLFALHFAGGGHNDVWMLVAVVAALVLADLGHSVAAGASWAVALCVKWVVAPLFPLVLIASRPRRSLAVGFVGAALVLGGAATVAFGDGWLGALVPLAGRRSEYSMPSRLAQLGLPFAAAALALACLAGVAFLWLARDARRRRTRLGLAAVVLMLATPWLLPWYAAWAVPLAVAEEDGVASWLAIALSAYLLPARVPF